MTAVLLLAAALFVPGASADNFVVQAELQGLYDEISQATLQFATASDVDEFLRRPSGAPAKLTAPASGLFLERVFYPGDEQSHPLVAAVPVPSARG